MFFYSPFFGSLKLKYLVYFLFIALLQACATPAQHFSKTALEYGFSEGTLAGLTFQHKIYSNKRTSQTQNSVLHVYLDGDGSPWKNAYRLSEDPTSRNPLILALMAQDNSPAIMLGRPCYHGFSLSTTCHPQLWTSARYSKQVVDSMATVLNEWLLLHSFKQIVLIGYSGGGTLAVLMANKIAAVTRVVTLAANLDVAAWSHHHGYSMLKDSLNPIKKAPLNSKIKQLHLSGGKDENVPAFVTKAYADKQKNTLFRVYDEFDHQCCWEQVWANILSEINIGSSEFP
ncbi:MAG: hypothetical protein GQ569_01900 [Methylococcaceae bacterium]|nr:hypothetical protein [Methylococcaceae bacterium]